MALKDIFNKGVELINNGVKTVSDAAKEKKASMEAFENLKAQSAPIGPLMPYEVKNADPQFGREQMILNTCLTLTVEKARIINKCVPIEETIVDVRTCKEASTNTEFSLVVTDKKFWIISQSAYMTLEFEQVKNFDIVNKGIMSQGVKFLDRAFTIDGNEESVKKFFELFENPEYRLNLTKDKLAYLCGVIPKKQILNKYLTGLTFGAAVGEIVLHNNQKNMVVNIKEINTVQLLINDSVSMVKGRANSTSFMSNPMEARKMSIKIILATGEFIMETMPQNTMGSAYKREDSTYIENFNFAKRIVDTLAQLIDNDIYGR